MPLSQKQVRYLSAQRERLAREREGSSDLSMQREPLAGEGERFSRAKRSLGRRGLLLLALGVGVLLVALFAGIQLASRNQPVGSSTPASISQAGPYTVALFTAPKLLSASQPARLTLRVTDTSTGVPVTDAGVRVEGIMDSMGMLTGALYANSQGDGSYVITTTLSMSGLWRFTVTIASPNASSVSTQFAITAQ